MLGTIRCPACGERLSEGDRLECTDCGRGYHAACEDNLRKYVCPRCADERWIGALEF